MKARIETCEFPGEGRKLKVKEAGVGVGGIDNTNRGMVVWGQMKKGKREN